MQTKQLENIKNGAILVFLSIGSFLFFFYFAGFGWLPSLLITLFYMYLMYRSHKKKEQILAEQEENNINS